MRGWRAYVWVLLGVLLGACGLPSPEQARRNLAPETPLTPEYRDIPLARIQLDVWDLYDLLFGESPNVRLFTVSGDQARGRIQQGDMGLEIGVPNFDLGFFVSALELNREVRKEITLPRIIGVNAALQSLLQQAQLPEAYLFQTLTLTLPRGYVRAKDIAVCTQGANSQCTGDLVPVNGGSTEYRFETGQPVDVVAEASALLNALGVAVFSGEVRVDLRLTPLADLGDLLRYVGQEGCSVLGCNIRQAVSQARVLAPFGAKSLSPFVVTTKALASPLGALPGGTVEELKRYTETLGLTLELESELPTEVLGVTLWAGTGSEPRFDTPLPGDFVYTVSDPIPAPQVDADGRSQGVARKTITVELPQEEARRFLGLLGQENVHVAARLRLQGPAGSQGVFRFKAQDQLRIFAKGTARLRIGR
ncbi:MULTISPECIES: hypothetical protein [Thermus]|uniref:Lipoprotein n=1 Tax=Thermus brockianus TaxID=56956 RepID=A0A1J0LW69_THEBO|nr:hypothetical protein [Thermus brockianus]APD10284.1 hypothetical protein A0O31_02250 [Thermus brockianus]